MPTSHARNVFQFYTRKRKDILFFEPIITTPVHVCSLFDTHQRKRNLDTLFKNQRESTRHYFRTKPLLTMVNQAANLISGSSIVLFEDLIGPTKNSKMKEQERRNHRYGPSKIIEWCNLKTNKTDVILKRSVSNFLVLLCETKKIMLYTIIFAKIYINMKHHLYILGILRPCIKGSTRVWISKMLSNVFFILFTITTLIIMENGKLFFFYKLLWRLWCVNMNF